MSPGRLILSLATSHRNPAMMDNQELKTKPWRRHTATQVPSPCRWASGPRRSDEIRKEV